MGNAKDYLALKEAAAAIDAEVVITLVMGGLVDGDLVAVRRVAGPDADLATSLAAIKAQIEDPDVAILSRATRQTRLAIHRADSAIAIEQVYRNRILKKISQKAEEGEGS